MALLSVLYRGPLSSCNFACGYCPFAKRKETRPQLARDRTALLRFVEWIAREREHQWRIVVTPWGEALVRKWYREAIRNLSHFPHVRSVGAQTNLSGPIDWAQDADFGRLYFWAAYHPGQMDRDRFLAKVRRLRKWGVRLSVGMVGVPDHLPEAQQLRAVLPKDVSMWINPQLPRSRPCTAEELEEWSRIDPEFGESSRRQLSRGRECYSGETTFTVDGEGDMRRCHFVSEVIGNIHNSDWLYALRPRVCPRLTCDCYLGTSQLKDRVRNGEADLLWGLRMAEPPGSMSVFAPLTSLE